MVHTYFFQYNIPAENQYCGAPDRIIDVIAKWDDTQRYKDGRPMVLDLMPVITHRYELMTVKDWAAATSDMEKIAEKYFAEAFPINPDPFNQADYFNEKGNAKDLGTIVINNEGKAIAI